jgi:selenocysteine-specific elongation factor
VLPAAVEPRLSALAGGQKLLRVPLPGEVRWVAPAVVARVVARGKRVLREYFQRDRLAEGMPKAEAVKRILRGRGGELADHYLQWLQAQKVLAVAGDRVAPPGRRAELSGEESQLASRVLAAFDEAGLTPPSPGDVTARLAAKPQIVEGVIRHLVDRRALVKLPGGLILSRAAVDALVRDLRQGGVDRFSVPQFKDRFGLSRKWAIPLLEHLDSVGVTRRVGDERQLVR